MKKLKRLFFIKYRMYFMKKLFTDREKYFIIRSIENRIDEIKHIAINDRWADKHNMYQDIRYLVRLKNLFSTKDWY